MGTIEYVVVATVAALVIALGAASVRGRESSSRAAPPSLNEAIRRFSHRHGETGPRRTTILMVAITLVMAAVIYTMIAGLTGR